jgi:hypothetical protein
LKDKRGLTAQDFALGKAVGLGFDGSASEPHPTTAALFQKLMGSEKVAPAMLAPQSRRYI